MSASLLWSCWLLLGVALMSCSFVINVSAVPNITRHPNSNGQITEAEGSDVELRCEATGNEELSYKWMRASGSLPKNTKFDSSGKILTICNITVNDSGEYYCIVSDNDGSASSMRVQVTVKRTPSIVSIPDDQQLGIISDNEQIMLVCEVSGDNIASVYWERINDDSLSNKNNMSWLSKDKTMLTMNITRARSEHSGKYRCVAYSQWGVGQSRNVQVNITIAPPTITRQPTNKMITALKDVTFRCKAKGFNVKYEWKRQNGTVNSGKRSTLTISKATPLHSDQYYCVAMTEGGSVESNYVTLTVNGYIDITSHPQSVTVAEGDMLSLSVSADGPGKDMFKYQWEKKDSTSLPSSVSGKNSTTLTISSVKRFDSGSYHCIVTNQWRNMTKSKEATVYVLQFTKQPNSNGPITRAEGTNVTLTCEATGAQNLVYDWKRVSGSLPSNVRSNGGKTLTILNIKNNDEGQYYCEVNNGGNNISSMRVQIIVKKRPSVNNPSDKALGIVSGDDQVMLTCGVTGDDITGGYWERVDGKSLPETNNMSSFHNKRTLKITITRARPEHSGRYHCVAYSQWGVAQSRNVQVTVTVAPPKITRQPTNKMITALQDVTFMCMAKGFNVTYEWKRHKNKQLVGRQSVLTISGVVPSDSDQYYCVAMTIGGYAFSNNVTLTVTIAPPMIIRQPTNKMITALQDVIFTCEAEGFNVKYEWKRHKNKKVIERHSTLTISEATPSDSDQYYCVAMTKGGYAFSNNVTLTVNDQLSISAMPPRLTIGEGDTAQFNATASGINVNNFVYQWRKRDSNSLPNKATGINETVLTIPNAQDSDEGNYVCIVTNEWGSSMRSNNIMLTVTANALEIKRDPQDQYVSVGQTAIFECFVTGSNSSFDVTWERNSRNINSRRFIATNTMHDKGVSSNLTIENVMVKDSGKYWCKATNADNDDFESTQAELIIIPEITSNPSNVTVLIDQSSQLLNCNAKGTKITYHWTKNNITIPGADSNELNIINITESDEGVYRCVASNKGDTVESYPATVTVYGPPMVKALPQHLYAVLGEKFQIMCNATNDQDAPMNLTFSWKTPNGVHFNITTTTEDNNRKAISTLHISSVTNGHDGMYKCTVSNGKHQGNNVAISSLLVVEERPSPPVKFNVTNIDVTLFQLIWGSPSNPNGSIDYYIVYYSSSSHDYSLQVNDTNFDGRYNLTNLMSYTTYSIYVTAVRLIGDNDRPLEGAKSKILIERTLAGEPEIITGLEVNQTKPEIILNSNSSMYGGRKTFDVDLPYISTKNGPFSHLYIIVVINSSAIADVGDVTTQQLLDHSMNNSMLFYIAAVVNASQYVQYVDDYRLRYALGAGDTTTDPYGHVFYNREVKAKYSFFYRVFSANSTETDEIYTTTKMRDVGSPQQSTADSGSSSSSSAIGPVIGVIVTLLLIIAVIIVVILLLFYYKKNYLKPKEKTGINKFVPVDAGIQLDKKEKIDKEGTPLSSLAATNPLPQETAFSPNSPLPLEVITSVGQPTTLFVELPYADDSEISWKKDGKPVTHPVLADGSLYIANTKLSDQGDYTVTATGTDNTTSENVQLKAVDPIMPTTLSEEHKPVKVEDFPEHIALMQSKKSIQFEEDYESVMIDVDFSQHAAKLHVNAAKNRYKNIIPFDHCRVVLSQLDQRPGSDYINASFVDGYKEPKAYIATQGPVSNTVDDFWRMVWEHNVTTIVMLTRLVEDSKVKCSQYWPESESATYGDFTVTITKHEVIAKYCIRKFIIEKISDHKSHEVCQFHFTAWPDHGVPKYGTDILEFHKRIDKYHTRKDGKPMLVHCSAGVGRTGTFIAIDIEIQRIDNDSLVDVHNSVCRLRFWRNFMVQTVDQYTLIFTALLEYIACGDTSIAAPTKSVQDKVKELSTVDPYTNKTGFEIQFETLTKNSPKEKEFSYSFATSSKNKSKNRNKKCLPPDASRVHLSKVGNKSDYINACYIDGYRHCKEFLVGPGPMESTSADFWRMVWENQSHAIVMLGQLKENGEEASFKYWPNKGDRCEYDKLAVETTAENCIDNNVTKRIMKVTHKETSATKTITQLQYVEWPQNSCPSSPNSIIEMTEILERVQRKTANGPITVHCSDGIGRSGTFCALMASMNRFKAEQMVDVFKTIITMRTQRPGLVANAEQYKFIHEALISMLMCYATYANFSGDNITIDSAVYENLPSTSM